MKNLLKFLYENYIVEIFIIVSSLSFYIYLIYLYYWQESKLLFFDKMVFQYLEPLQNKFLQFLMILITNLFSPFIFIILFFILLYYLLKYRKIYYFIFTFVTIPFLFILETIFKLVIHRARPEFLYYSAHGFSFPSAHSLFSVFYFLIVLFAFSKELKQNKKLLYTIGVLIILVPLSRVYLHVHWASDVLAGISLAIFIFTSLNFVKHIYSDTIKEQIKIAESFYIRLNEKYYEQYQGQKWKK